MAEQPSRPVIHTDDVLDALRAVVAEYGRDYRYWPPGQDGCCYYAWASQPSCLIGCVLHRLGASLDDLSAIEGMRAGVLGTDKHPLPFTFTRRAALVLTAAQMVQDFSTGWWGEELPDPQSGTWGRALDAAEAAATGVYE